jgi:tetratricopeptide (TPR) repeat protein
MSESYKKWILVGIAFLVGVLFTLIVINPSLKNRKVAENNVQGNAPPPQLSGSGQTEILPAEELGVDITDPQALASLGDQYFENNNFMQAIEIYKRVLGINPDDVDTYNDLGLAYLYTGNPGLAEETLIKGIDTSPEYQRIWLSLGFVLKSIGENEKARPVLQNALDMGPDNEVGQEALRLLEQL